MGHLVFCYMEVAVNIFTLNQRFRSLVITGVLAFGLFAAGCSDMMMNTVASRNSGIQQYRAGQYAEAIGTLRTTLRNNPADYPSH